MKFNEVKHSWSGIFAADEQLPFIRASGGGSIGVFELSSLITDIDILDSIFFSTYGSVKFFVITDEEDFSVNIKEVLISYFQGGIDVDFLIERFLFSDLGFVLSCDESEEEGGVVEGWYKTNNNLFAKVIEGEG